MERRELMSIWAQMLFGGVFGMAFGLLAGTYGVSFIAAGLAAAALTFVVMVLWSISDSETVDQKEA